MSETAGSATEAGRGMEMPPESEYGTLDLSELVGQWDKMRWFHANVLEPAARREDHGLTARRFDESQPAGHRVYIGAAGQISNGMEHIDALQTLLQERATPRAPWTLLRSIYEAGFWTCWLLEPADGALRRQRGLHMEVQSMKQRSSFYATFFKHRPADHAGATEDHADHIQGYRRECDALGLKWSVVNNKINVIDALDRLQVVADLEPDVRAALQAVWRSLSGMQHGHAYAVMLNSDLQPGARDILGGKEGVVTINDDAFTSSASAANLLLMEGMKLYVERSTQPA